MLTVIGSKNGGLCAKTCSLLELKKVPYEYLILDVDISTKELLDKILLQGEGFTGIPCIFDEESGDYLGTYIDIKRIYK